jgi:hypothetical protein
MNMKVQLNFSIAKPFDDAYNAIVELGIGLAQSTINTRWNRHPLATNYALGAVDYRTDSKAFRDMLLKYCAQKAGIPDLDANNLDQCKDLAARNEVFLKEVFAIQGEILNQINSANELEDSLGLANVSTVGWGDSKTFAIGPKSLYLVQDDTYGNNVSRYQKEFQTDVTIVPSPKTIAIAYDVFQMMMVDYDWAAQIAKVAMSVRARMYQDVVDAIYAVANLTNTPFYKANFSKTVYIENVDRLAAANNASVRAYGTRQAFGRISDTIDRGFNVQDEYVNKGYIGDLYGVPSIILQQAVDSNTSSYTFRVPNDRILLLPMVGDRPIKVVQEGSVVILNEDGENAPIKTRNYKYQYSWNAALCTQCSYGIQGV